MQLEIHHFTLTVRKLEVSQPFYEKLGFKQVHRWDADDKSLSIVHLKLDNVFLELFAFSKNRDLPALELEAGNDLSSIGVKYFGLRVDNVKECLTEMQANGYTLSSTEVTKGRTGIDYFFIKDPDGMWVGVFQDDRGY